MHAPIGLDIGAVTPQEIAVSIVAELIAVRRGKARGHRRRVAALDAEGQGSPRALSRRGRSLLVRNATILTMNDAFDIVEGDVLIDDGRIAAVGGDRCAAARRGDDRRGRRLPAARLRPDARPSVPDALSRLRRRPRAARLAAHAHLADGGGAHAGVARAPPRALAAAELLLGGTTTVLTMETVHDTDAVFEALEPTGLRAVVGKCMMDADAAVPARLLEQTQASIDESLALARALERPGQRPVARGVRAALRGVVLARAARGGRPPVAAARDCSCTRHASENRDEIALVRERTGLGEHRLPGRGRAGRVGACAWRTACGWTMREQAAAGRAARSRCCTAPART